MGLFDFLSKKSECSVCGQEKNWLLLQDLYNGKICTNCINKLKIEGDIKTLSVSDAIKRYDLYNELEKTNSLSLMPPYPYTNIDIYKSDKQREKYIHSSKYKRLSEAYYKDLPSIDSLWSVLYNLNDFNGDNALQYENICLQNISNFKRIYDQFCIPYGTIEFDCVPAYKRLAMLYEKQKKYREATLVCMDAIQHNASNEYGDNNAGKMYSRLARMAKKAGLLEDANIKLLLSKK